MKLKKLKADQVFEHHTVLGLNIDYTMDHVFLDKGTYVVFAGSPRTGPHTYVVHGNLTEGQIGCLQIILSYGCKVSKIQYRQALLRLMTIESSINVDNMKKIIHCSKEWIVEMLGLESVPNIDKMCLSNAYHLSKVRYPDHVLMGQAEKLVPWEFAPICLQRVKEQRK